MKKLFPWWCLVLLLIIIFGSIYAVVQQSQRLSANYPQIQIAEDTAVSLNHGTKPEDLTNGKINIDKSLAPFVIIYSKSGKIVSGSGYINGRNPEVPIGVLEASKGKDYSWVSWQPQDNIRIASVSVSANNYFVLSGRSLKEIEKDENRTFYLSFGGGIASLIVLSASYLLSNKGITKHK